MDKKNIKIKDEVFRLSNKDEESIKEIVQYIVNKFKYKSSFAEVFTDGDNILIMTSYGTIQTDNKFENEEKYYANPVSYTTGNNATGHKLPASSTGPGDN